MVMNNAFDTSQGLMSGAGDVFKNVAGTSVMQNVNDYLNPYYNQVLNKSLGRMRDERDMSLNLIGDQATAARAFGSGRQGLMEGQMLADHNQNVGELASNLYATGFNNAVATAGQDRAQQMNAANQMANLGQNYYGIGTDILNRQQQAGTMQQMLEQQILQGGQQQQQAYLQHPYQIVDMMNAIMSQDPRKSAMTQTSQSKPGIMDWLSLAAGVLAL